MFTPALRIDRLPRAQETGADVCLLDLEDSVGNNYKDEAREKLCNFLRQPKPAKLKLAVRINSLDDDLGIKDVLALGACPTLPDYLVVPKSENKTSINVVEKMLGAAADRVRFIALIESVSGVQNIDEIAGASQRMCGLMLGSADYSRSISGEICWDTLLFPRTVMVHAASKYQLGVIDTPYFDIPDLDGLAQECSKVKRLGFTGRCAIHPSQVETVNGVFSYSADIIERSRKIVEAGHAAQGNICKVDGQMVGKPIIEQARRILESIDARLEIESQNGI
jgi:citrate lyase beta subunit